MATQKQVQSLAEKMINLLGKMDLEVENREKLISKEAANMTLSKDIVNKNIEND